MSATIVNDPTRAPFTKAIEPVWETEGKRRRICGFHAFLNGNVLTIPGSTYPALFNAHGDAERALDAAALEAIEAETPTIAGVSVELVQEVAAELAYICHQSSDTRGRNAYNR